jgi:hypothetical protein
MKIRNTNIETCPELCRRIRNKLRTKYRTPKIQKPWNYNAPRLEFFLFWSFEIVSNFEFRASNFISLESWKPSLFLQKSVVLYFNRDRDKLSIGNEFRPVDIAAVDYG